jgi:hypothetical protein
MKISKRKELYKNSKEAKVGETCICPACNTEFIKESYQQAFCKTKSGTKCKDFYWNNVTPNKRNNKTRISPASAEYLKSRPKYTSEGYKVIDGVAYDEFDEPMYNVDEFEDRHPFDLED